MLNTTGTITRSAIIILLLIIVFPSPCMTAPIDIPPELENWKSWVLHGKEDKSCPTDYNDSNKYRCTWPSGLQLFIESTGGRFEQEWQIFSKTWVPLPGGPENWPVEVRLNQEKVPVMNRDNVPSVYMTPGEHRLQGEFQWNEVPEMINIPPGSGLVELTINGHSVDFPMLDKDGRLWLQKRAAPGNKEDRTEVRIFRLLEDTIPMKVTNHLQIHISGRSREIRLDRILLQNTVPMNIESQLPVRIGPDGDLMIQARPGRWDIEIITRFENPVYEIGPVKGKYGQEIWSLNPQHHLRTVQIKGVPFVEPAQTNMPDNWKKYPAYIVGSDSTVIIKELRRGDPDPAPDRLNLNRTWWLDFDGKGFTVNDRITGTMSRQWYLSMNPPGIPGRVSVDGADWLITLQDNKPGVELRRGEIDLSADSRFEASTSLIPAVGWDHDFQTVSGTLKLPPGWQLFAASGADALPEAWIECWSLWDLFFVLIISIAVLMIKNKLLGISALVTMILIYQEPDAPRFIWLIILAGLALLRVLSENQKKHNILYTSAISDQ